MTQVILTSGTSWTVPSDCASATVEAIGGGQGGNATNGGNGGDYAKAANLALNPGDTIAVQIGAGGAGVTSGAQNAGTDTKFGSAVLAKGGGSASADVGDVSFAGGSGDSSGAGGAAAGAGGAGASASGTTPGAGDGDLAGGGGAPSASSSPMLIRLVPQAPATKVTIAGIDLDLGVVQEGDQVVVVVGSAGGTNIVLTVTDSQSNALDAPQLQDANNSLTNLITRVTVAADSDYKVHVAPSANTSIVAAAYLLRGKVLTADASHAFKTEANADGNTFPVGPYSTAKPSFLAMVAVANQNSSQTIGIEDPTNFVTDASISFGLCAHWLDSAPVTGNTQILNDSGTNPYTAALIVPYTWT